MKTTVFTLLLFFSSVQLFSQSESEHSKQQPQIQIHTEHEYDEDGNLIRVDSVYTYSYSSSDFTDEEMDSLFYNNESDAYHRYNFDHFFNRPMPALPYQFHFDFDEEFYDNFNWPNGNEPDWQRIDSLFQEHLKNFQQNMDELFREFYEENNHPIPDEKFEDAVDI